MKRYDLVIVGAGVGGCTVAYRFASLGKKVLLVDKGKRDKAANAKIDERIYFAINSAEYQPIDIPLADGFGGNSQIYGGQLSRYDRSCFKSAISSNNVFPFSYAEIEPYYEEIESLFKTDQPNFLPSEKQFIQEFESCGFTSIPCLHAMKFIEGCDGCGGKICPHKCKSDFFTVLCSAWFTKGNIEICEGTEVVKIANTNKRVEEIVLLRNGQIESIVTESLVIATGALKTTSFIKEYLGEVQGNAKTVAIGSGITFHISDFYLLFPKFRQKWGQRRHKLLNGRIASATCQPDFPPFSLQSVGAPIEAEYITRFLLRRAPKYLLGSKLFLAVVKYFAVSAAYFGKKGHVVATVIQDPVNASNVLAVNTKAKIQVNYTINKDLKRAIKDIDRKIRQLLKRRFFVFRLGSMGNINYGHPMGGCAMGDQDTNLVTECGRLKPFKNVYIADASVFPISGDTNPSLTISAVALRTADKIIEGLK